MTQTYGKGRRVQHYRNVCAQHYANVHDVTLKDGTLVARYCADCGCVSYTPWVTEGI